MNFPQIFTLVNIEVEMYHNKEGILDIMPREKAIKYGINKLSDRELLSILIGSGSKDISVIQLSRKLLHLIDKTNGTFTLRELMEIKGIGEAKATLISAAMEFSRRILHPHIIRVSYPTDILPLVRHYVTRSQEYFIVISLNGAHEVINSRVVSLGILNRTLIHPREVYTDPIKERAASIILAHNHPSGNLEPSREDIDVTKRLVKAGELLGINVLDHVIFSNREHYSFAEENLL